MADRYQNYPGVAGGAGRRANAVPESDPLAELARLIGQTDPQSPFARSNAPAEAERETQYAGHDPEPEAAETQPTRPSWMRAAASADREHRAIPASEREPQQHHHPEQYEQADHSQTPAFLRTMRQHDNPSRYDDALYGANPQQAGDPDQHTQNPEGYAHGADDPHAYPPYYDDVLEEEKPKRSGMMTVVAVLALAVVGTGGAFAYRHYTGPSRTSEPPVIKAEQGSNKIVPPTQTADASGKIIDRIGGSAGGPERVLPREEQPVDINGRNAPRVVFPPVNQAAAASATAQPAIPQPAAPAMRPAAMPQQQAAASALGDEPKRVRTLSIRSDQPDSTASQASPLAPRPAAPAVARAQAAAPSANSPISLSPQGSATPVRTAAIPSSGNGGGYVVQISSQRSEADAQASYRAMQSKFPNVLGSRSAMIRRADLGEKGVYYRAMVGPFAAADDAGQLCSSLKAAGGQCVVQRN